jgi:ribosomal protein L32
MSKKPVPSKKQARSSTRSRWSSYMQKQRKRMMNRLAFDTCETTGEVKLRHFASPSGFYKGRKVFKTRADKQAEAAQTIEA